MSTDRQIKIWNKDQKEWLDDFKRAQSKKYEKFVLDSTKKPAFRSKMSQINSMAPSRSKSQKLRRLNEEIEQDARQEISNFYIRRYRTIIDDFHKGGLIDKKSTGPYKLMKKVRTPGNSNRSLQRNKAMPGMWYLFMYDPITKKELEFYDRLPLVMVLETFNDGFLGLNFHHMHPRFRRRFIQFAEQFKRGQGLQAHIDLEWDKIKRLDKYKFGRPIIRRYKYSNIRSRLIKIPLDDWELMVIIPSLRLFGMQQQGVWQKTTREALRS